LELDLDPTGVGAENHSPEGISDGRLLLFGAEFGLLKTHRRQHGRLDNAGTHQCTLARLKASRR